MTYATPDEGMWLPLYLKKYNEADMKKKGFKLTAEDIYDINQASLKDAIVRLGDGFCTAEIVSGQGLLFTNHHCGYDAIAGLSTKENNLLDNGFFAKSLAEEIHAPEVTASILQYMQDVTGRMMDSLKNVDDAKRGATAARVGRGIVEEVLKMNATLKADGYTAEVKPFFEGNQYFVMVYKTYRDVRLVGTPPNAIGKFGGDTDNWMWPRHTGDFSILRIYTGADGKPADFNTANVPLKPKKSIPVSLNGYKPGDYAMVMGYPGTTNRYLTSYGMQVQLDYFNPSVVALLAQQMASMKEQMDADVTTRLKLAGDYASLANTWKYYLGQMEGLKQNDVISEKKLGEKRFMDWVNGNATRKAKYGTLLDEMQQVYNLMGPLQQRSILLGNAAQSADALQLAGALDGLYLELKEKDKKEIAEDADKLKGESADFFKEYNVKTDKAAFLGMLTMVSNLLPKTAWPEALSKVYAGPGTPAENARAWVDNQFATSILTDKARMDKFLKKPSLKVLEADGLFKYHVEMFEKVMASQSPMAEQRSKLGVLRRKYVQGLMEMQPDAPKYPDANSTLRVSYGTVQPYEPRDAVAYNYYTTIDGVVQKEDPTSDEFKVPAELTKIYKNKDFGRYASNGTVNTCFITTNDITGGNSGSPVFNDRAELIGIAFDGNWESMTGDLKFSDEMQRCIVVDIRYVLLTIDKMYGATRLINELTIAPTPIAPSVQPIVQPIVPKPNPILPPKPTPIKLRPTIQPNPGTPVNPTKSKGAMGSNAPRATERMMMQGGGAMAPTVK